MVSDATRPPAPGPIIQPNFLDIEEAVGAASFPISKRELVELVGENTVTFQGRNVDLAQLIKDLDDDFFDSEDEFRETLERNYGAIEPQDESATAPDLEPWPGRERGVGAIEPDAGR